MSESTSLPRASGREQRPPALALRDQWPHLVHLAALAPLVITLVEFFLGRLTVNPIQDFTHRSGYAALVLLVASLACTPLNILFGFKRALTLRRPLGLYAFGYALLHMLIFALLDFGLDPGLIWQEVVEKRYILVGSAALLLLIPLALTSTKGWQRRLGKRWKSLHRLVYLAAPLAVIHYVWLVKADIREPLIFGAIVALLLLLRLTPVRQAIARLRSHSS
jgi:sulfoxide reductase heme-binding subunit YedZ